MDGKIKQIFETKRAEILFIITVLGVGSAAINLLISTQLVPLAARQDLTNQRVQAIEETIKAGAGDSQRLSIVETRTSTLVDDVREIKGDVKSILRELR